MRIGWQSLCPILLLLTSLCTAAKERISILDFTVSQTAKKAVNADASQDLTQQVRDAATSMVDASKFEIMTRENIMVMLPPGKKSLAECEGQCEVDMARNLGSRWHVVGDIKKPGTKLILSIRLYDVVSATQLGGVRAEAANVDALIANATPKARDLLGKIPGVGSSAVKTQEDASSTVEAETPAAPPPASATKYVVNFESVPKGAAVSSDGNFLCTAPNSKTLAQGEHWIAMGKDGYCQKKEKVSVSKNGQNVSFTLSEITTRLSLEAVDDRTGGDLVADVYVDGVKVGQTPFSGLVAVAARKIEVAPEGFGRKTVSVALEEGKEASGTAHFRSVEKPKVGAEMVAIPAGCFEMGSPSGVGDRDERPQHRVCLSAFHMDATEVTQSDYKSSMGRNPSSFPSCGGNCPVENVNWNQAKSYCEHKGKRLPTEAEWEYAARAGAATKWYWGSEDGVADEYAWHSGCSEGHTHPVGQKRPNDWGLYDMAGNVWEWVSDWKGDYPSEPQQDPTGPSSGSLRVRRGGGWIYDTSYLRSAVRLGNFPESSFNNLGFRCVSP